MNRIFVEKKPGFDVEAKALLKAFNEQLAFTELIGLRIVNVYDIDGVDAAILPTVVNTILSEPNVDDSYIDDFQFASDLTAFGVAYLAGQFDQRADSAEACIQILSGGTRPTVKSSKLYLLAGKLSTEQIKAIKSFLINPVDSTEISIEKPTKLIADITLPAAVKQVDKFIEMTQAELAALAKAEGFAMKMADLLFIQDYFKQEKRNPTITELKAIDTYWSDHCRHTTFFTELTDINFADDMALAPIKDSYQRYLAVRQANYKDKNKPISLMDLAVIAAKDAVRTGDLDNLDVSEEINACSIKIPVNTNQGRENWLLMFAVDV